MNRIFKALVGGLVAGFLMVGPAGAINPSEPEVWSANYEDDPEAGDNVSQGDDWFRQHKKEIRRRMEVEHQIGSGAGPAVTQGDNGAHRLGSARVFMSSTEPTALTNSSELHDNTSPGSGSGTLSVLETNAPNSTDEALGHGRLNVDMESYTATVYDDVDASASTNWGWKELAAPRTVRRNRVLNGGFERDGLIGVGLASCTDTEDTPARDPDPDVDNGGNQTSGSAVDGFCDAEVTFEGNAGYYEYVGPGVQGWTVMSTPDSFDLVDTDDENGFGYAFKVGSDSAGDGIEQTLADLEASTEYQVTASIIAETGATCSLDVGGESSTDLPVTSTATTYTVLTGFFITDSTPTSITLELDETAGAASCTWDNVTVQRVDTQQAVPNQDWIYSQEDLTSDNAAEALNTDQLVWAGGSCYWEISWSLNSNGSAVVAALEFDEDEDGNWTPYRTIANLGSNTVRFSGSLVVFEADLDAAAAAGGSADSGDAVEPGDDVRWKVTDSTGSDLECTPAGCFLTVEQSCSSI